MDRIAGLPFGEVPFDADGDVDRDAARAAVSGLRGEGVTDVVVFAHGWNNDTAAARRLYERFFGQFPALLAGRTRPGRTVGLLGVRWPSKRWSDEPEPDFDAGLLPALDRGGAAGVGDPPPTFAPPPWPSAATAAVIREAFPDADPSAVDELVELLRIRPPGEAGLQRAHDLVTGMLRGAPGPASADDGDGAGAFPAVAGSDRKAREVARSYLQELEQLGVTTSGHGGPAGLAEDIGRLWHGTQELARQATYWQMRNRAGVVGERGLGPFLAELLAADMQVDLVGHSFGARLVSYALRALDPPQQVRSVVLLQGAFSQFAFADALPHDPGRSGALRGAQARVAGPVIACHSRFDGALGTFYPLASLPAGQDAVMVESLRERWGAIGFDGHKPHPNRTPMLAPAAPYTFAAGTLTSIDAARVVRHGRPPSGAHSDIVHPELAWIVLCAAGLIADGPT
ncbi:serine-threonine protein kinase [Pseudonocardia kunmingensis]|uniref:Serine-threonine protein kinase n=1 Tax=Pseudonocardia kunmingensis TaxID=630975 RepID=A0A543DIG0_9PSEU|nr:serine-threonine protein kinase [Pseudonocardia kunmingensis]TQM09126.1 hypothetical protein FB558_4875 [Pseudonocardia kunmingensis]